LVLAPGDGGFATSRGSASAFDEVTSRRPSLRLWLARRSPVMRLFAATIAASNSIVVVRPEPAMRTNRYRPSELWRSRKLPVEIANQCRDHSIQ